MFAYIVEIGRQFLPKAHFMSDGETRFMSKKKKITPSSSHITGTNNSDVPAVRMCSNQLRSILKAQQLWSILLCMQQDTTVILQSSPEIWNNNFRLTSAEEYPDEYCSKSISSSLGWHKNIQMNFAVCLINRNKSHKKKIALVMFHISIPRLHKSLLVAVKKPFRPHSQTAVQGRKQTEAGVS